MRWCSHNRVVASRKAALFKAVLPLVDRRPDGAVLPRLLRRLNRLPLRQDSHGALRPLPRRVGLLPAGMELRLPPLRLSLPRLSGRLPPLRRLRLPRPGRDGALPLRNRAGLPGGSNRSGIARKYSLDRSDLSGLSSIGSK